MLETLYPQLDEKVELVISDLLFDHRDLGAYIKPYEDKISYKIIKQSSWWSTNGHASFSESFNQAAEASSGSYLVILNDCLSFPPGFFSKLKEKRDAKKTAQILYVDKAGHNILANPDGLESAYSEVRDVEGDYGENWVTDSKLCVGDSRWLHTPWGGKTILKTFKEVSWQSCYSLFSIPSETFFELNGFDENFEGIKGLNDVEFFSRLQTRDSSHPIEFDKSFYVYHHRHHGVRKADNTGLAFPEAFRSNYDLIYLMRFERTWQANNRIRSREDLSAVLDASLMGIPQLMTQAEDYPSASPGLKYWIENQPIKQYTQGGRYDKAK
jgi:hypothetical protein